jgi:protein subunit release factor A
MRGRIVVNCARVTAACGQGIAITSTNVRYAHKETGKASERERSKGLFRCKAIWQDALHAKLQRSEMLILCLMGADLRCV